MRAFRLLACAALAVIALLPPARTAAAPLFPTTTSISTSPNPSCPGQAVTVRASVISGNPVDPTPSGNVDFSDGATLIRTVPLDGNGVASFSTAALGSGSHNLGARYSGDLLNDASTSSRVSQQVRPSCSGSGGGSGGKGGGSPLAQAPPPSLIAAAGDIACGPNNPSFNAGAGTPAACQQQATANLLTNRSLDAVLPLGDLQYDQNGSLSGFLSSYDPTWGRYRAISHPVVGNHEYDDQLGAQGYWDYWNGTGARGGRAGVRGRGWYSFDLGSWHLVALNSNCDIVACGGHSRQIRWLRRDLRRHKGRCVLAYMHHPRFSSGLYEEHMDSGVIWRVLYRRGTDVVLNGHDHIYERFAPLRPNGRVKRKRGIRAFTVGTGGDVLFSIGSPRAAHSRFATANFGVLFMRLAQKDYGWAFVNTVGQTVDAGKRACHPAWPRRHHGKHGHAHKRS